MTQFLVAVEVRQLGDLVGSLASEGETVLGALDFMLLGFEAVKARCAAVRAAKATLEAGARHRITRPGRWVAPKRQRGVNRFGRTTGLTPPHGQLTWKQRKHARISKKLQKLDELCGREH